MAKFLVNIDLVQNQILNSLFQVIGSDPGAPLNGQFWYNSTSHRLKYRSNGVTVTPWVDGADIPAGNIANSKLTTDPLARANHTGTQLLATISNVTATAAEVNILAGTLVSAAELNFVDGVTSNIQTQLDARAFHFKGAAYTTATAAATAAKTVTGNEPATNSFVTITYTNGNSAAGATVSFNAGAARSVLIGGAAAGVTAHTVAAGTEVTYYFDGTNLNMEGSQSNTNDSTLLARANHTGTQLAATISDFATAAGGTTVGGDLTGTVSNAQIGAGVIVNADINASAAIALSKLAVDPLARANHTGTQTAATISDFDTQVRTSRLDQMAVPTASVSLNNQKITNVGNATLASDAVNKGQLDSAVAGLSWKQAVRAATTAAGTLASSFANASVVDGVTLATNDRILIKNQSIGGENGIYTVNATGAPTRATDNDTSAEMQGAAVMVQEGTAAGNSQWVQTVDGAITIGTTTTTWSQFGGGATYTAGNGLTLAANDFNVGQGTGIVVAADTVSIDTAVVVRKFAANVGNGSLTSLTVTHNLNTLDVQVEVVLVATGETVLTDVTRTGVNAVDVIFAVAPTTNQYRVLVSG